jgi:hypothetical protein
MTLDLRPPREEKTKVIKFKRGPQGGAATVNEINASSITASAMLKVSFVTLLFAFAKIVQMMFF